MSYIGNEPIVSATRTITEVTATAGQTVFVANGGYTVGYIDVFLNGAQLQTVDFTATNGSSITLTEAAQVGDVLKLVAWGTFQTSSALTANNPSYTGTLTGGTGVVNIGSGQVYKDASGNVGIGTSSPTTRLDIVGTGNPTLTIRGSDAAYTGTLNIQSAGGGASTINATGGTGTLNFQTGSSDRMRIDSSGNLLVGATSFVGVNARMAIRNIAGDANNQVLQIQAQATSVATTMIGFYDGAGTFQGQIFSSPSTDTTTYATSSDYRLKENIAPMTGALSVVQQLKPVTYSWKKSGIEADGFIAHELQEICPQAVVGEKDATDENGNIIPQMIDTSFLVATLTAAIQEQQAIITDLKSRIETLESK